METFNNDYEWTKSGARLRCLSPENKESDLNFLFIPAPGLGSESLDGLITLLKDQINMCLWLLDYPNDGSNIDQGHDFANWYPALIESIVKLNKPVLIAHSTGAMFVQSISNLETLVSGVILMNTAPNMDWKDDCNKYMQENTSPEIISCANRHLANPSDETLRALIISALMFSFMPKSMDLAVELLKKIPINHQAAAWSDNNFDPVYKAKFIPQLLPTIIMSGEHDQITPLTVYTNKEEYHKQNILLQSIPDAKHYPWIDNPQEVLTIIHKFINDYL